LARRATSAPALPRLLPVALATIAVVAACGHSAGKESALEKEQANYASKTDPVDKAKTLAKLGILEMKEALRQLKAGNDDQALSTVRGYRDQVQKTTQALVTSGRDAVKHPAGFKELQISIRQCLGRLDDMILELPVDSRPWFRAVRTDLVNSQSALIDALFPSVRKFDGHGKRARS
jgi:hypothetical protein